MTDINTNNSTVTNYCIGIRAIGVEYKKIYLDLWDKYLKDRNLNFIEKNKRETLIDINSEEYRNSEKDGVDPNADFDAIGIAKKVLTEEEYNLITRYEGTIDRNKVKENAKQ